MKRFILPLAAALLLTGCTAGSPAAAPSAPAESHAVQVAATPEPSATPSVDVKQAKADALAAGRPEAAWDKNCVAWKMPKADTKGQEWANKLGQEFLDSKDAACPDAIVYPDYFIESFKPGANGELVVIAEAALKDVVGVDIYRNATELEYISSNVFSALKSSNPDLKKVTAKLPGTEFSSQTSK